MIMKKKVKVIVAMSGGVDSSVAAALLKSRGFNVTGVFMKFWQAPGNKPGQSWNRCCSVEAASRARAVARKLNIPFYVVNFSAEFKGAVVDYFLKEYKEGRTPNPCIVCNKEIKFGLLLKKLAELKADYIATGHYAQIKQEFQMSNVKCQANDKCQISKSILLRAKDKTKDQTYFLSQLKQNQLKKILFPVGDYAKKQVRALAKKFDLPTAETPESQEVCFVETTTFKFLEKYLGQRPGKIVDEAGKVIGEHQGLWFYTIGQRKGIGLSGGPYYVIAKKTKANKLIVSKNKKLLETKEIIIKNINWLTSNPLPLPLKVMAKIRYNAPLAPATVKRISASRYQVTFTEPQTAPALGQSLVIYSTKKPAQLLASGIIV